MSTVWQGAVVAPIRSQCRTKTKQLIFYSLLILVFFNSRCKDTFFSSHETKKGVSFLKLLYKRWAATYFSTNKCSIIGDVRLLPGSDTCLPTHSSLISYNSSIYNYYHSSFFCRHLNSFFFNLILLSCLQLLSLLLSLPTLELFRFDYLQHSPHLSSAVPLSCRLILK